MLRPTIAIRQTSPSPPEAKELTARCSITRSVFYRCSGLLQALPLVMIATFHDDDPELATPVLERVCNQTTIMEQPATTAQPPSNEVARTIEMFRPKMQGQRIASTHGVRDRRLRQRVVAGLGAR
jgi:hypothetical protein